MTQNAHYCRRLSSTPRAERDNLKKPEGLLNVPKVVDYYEPASGDYLLIGELPGKNLVELIGEWAAPKIVSVFAKAVQATP